MLQNSDPARSTKSSDKYFCWKLLDFQNFTDEATMEFFFPHFHTNFITFLYSVQLQVSSAQPRDSAKLCC